MVLDHFLVGMMTTFLASGSLSQLLLKCEMINSFICRDVWDLITQRTKITLISANQFYGVRVETFYSILHLSAGKRKKNKLWRKLDLVTHAESKIIMHEWYPAQHSWVPMHSAYYRRGQNKSSVHRIHWLSLWDRHFPWGCIPGAWTMLYAQEDKKTFSSFFLWKQILR